MESMWSCFLAIKMGATTRQRKQAPSNDTNRTFMILTFDGITAIKMGATTRQSKQAASNYTNRGNTANLYHKNNLHILR